MKVQPTSVTTAEGATSPLLETRELSVTYRSRGRPPTRALDGVSIDMAAGETVGLVGESGSGKSTLGKAVLGLAPVQGGSVRFDGRDITCARRRERRELARQIQMVFQDPYSSLNPEKQVGETLAEPLRVHARLGRREVASRVKTMLELVGLPATAAQRYPRQFSGGQRQRIAIARALMLSPRLVICDEPVSALDLSIQAQILNLFADVQRELGLSYLFIAHDLAVVHYMCERIYVIYRGQIVEQGSAQDVYGAPAHPYTRRLLASSPVPDPKIQRARQSALRDEPATQRIPVSDGCSFALRCPYVVDVCRRERPQLHDGRSACHRHGELPAASSVDR
jgi:oligopeptide/dipeptide ABC transporter ATP-binding protein